MDTAPKYYGYIRNLGDDPIEAQRAINQWAHTNSIELAHCYLDCVPELRSWQDPSGTVESLLRTIVPGDHLVVNWITQLGNSFTDSIDAVEDLFERGIHLHVLFAPFPMNEYTRELTLAHLDTVKWWWQSWHDLELARRATPRPVHDKDARRYGFRRTGHGATPAIAERTLIRQIYRRVQEGESPAAIARELASHNTRTPNLPGEHRMWSAHLIRRVAEWFGKHTPW
jgi:hypothetical protein